MAIPSYYFTLFSKLQVLGHVPDDDYHGQAAGGFDLDDPQAVFGSSSTGALLGATNTPADSPLWAVLNSRAMGNPGFSPVVVGGGSWPTMPVFDTPAWDDFQVSAPAPKLVSVLGDWIIAGKTNDVPQDVLAQVPPRLKRAAGPVALFACSIPGDDGVQSVPSNYWATSLVFLVDPLTGATVNPSQLAATEEYYLAAVVGNRGGTGAGRFAAGGGVKVECEAWVMVWNTGFSPAVKLPALSNLDVAAAQPVHEVYFIDPGAYAVAGFRLPVQTVFDGLAKAIEEAGVDLGGLTPSEWIHAENAHLCARVMVRHVNQGWPAPGATPLDDRRVAQKNLAPFAIDLSVEEPDPTIDWTHFMVGDTMPRFAREPRAGGHTLTLVNRARGTPLDLYLAVPRRSFETLVDAGEIRGFRRVEGERGPFPDGVVLRCVSPRNSLPVRALGDRRFMAASLGIGYSRSQLARGLGGPVSVVQRTVVPVLHPAKQTYQLRRVVVGGLTLDVRVVKGSGGLARRAERAPSAG